MDANPKDERVYVPALPKSAPSTHRRRCMNARTGPRIFLAAIVTAVLLGVHYSHDFLIFHKPQPRTFVHPLRTEPVDFDWYALEPSRNLDWVPCYHGQKCARLLLPLDYDTPDGPTTAIALRMIPASSKEHYRGTLFVNPGGPGAAGTELVERRGQNITNVVGPSFDVLGFDPRGTGMSTPIGSCFDSDSQRDIWRVQEGHQLLNASDSSAVTLFRARAKVLAQRCADRLGGEWGIGRFMSTPNVARDMLEISQKLGQDKLQYWGFSYGSILGQYFAAMYPDKIKRLAIDGVYDAYNYRASLWNSNIVDVDACIDALFTFCHRAGPAKCALYSPTRSRIRDRFFHVLDDVEKNPVAIPLADPPLVVTRKALLAQLLTATYLPLRFFGPLVDTIHAIETGNTTALAALAPQIVSPTECECEGPSPKRPLGDNDATFAIACGDGDELTWDPEGYQAYYKTLEASSSLMAPLWTIYRIQCMEWTMRPKWRWTGPLEAANTSHPILVVSTTFDPVTPLADARKAHKAFGGSGLLVQDSYGHCSLSSPSLCTAKHVRRYFHDGTLPEEGTVCDVEELPLIGQSESQEQRSLNAEDATLLEALKGLSKDIPVHGVL